METSVNVNLPLISFEFFYRISLDTNGTILDLDDLGCELNG